MSKEWMLKQRICGNKSIFQNGISIFLPNWAKSGLNTVKDIWDTEKNCWKDGYEIYTQLICKRNWIAEYNKIKAYIPIEWKIVLKGEDVKNQTTDLIMNTKSFVMSSDRIEINGKPQHFKKIKQK